MLQPFTIAPNFIVRDALAAAAYYRDRLGFAIAHTTGEPADFVIVQGHGATVFLKSRAGVEGSFSNQRAHEDLGWDAYLCVADVDALHADFQRRGARVTREPEDAPYSFRDFEVEDSDGYLLCVGQDLNGPPPGSPFAVRRPHGPASAQVLLVVRAFGQDKTVVMRRRRELLSAPQRAQLYGVAAGGGEREMERHYTFGDADRAMIEARRPHNRLGFRPPAPLPTLPGPALAAGRAGARPAAGLRRRPTRHRPGGRRGGVRRL